MASVEDTINFFDSLDSVLGFHVKSIVNVKPKGNKETVVNKILLFKDFMTVEGNFKKPLFDFISWLISDNERELYLAKKCNLKFLHLQGKLSLLRVCLHLDSRCLITTSSKDWVTKTLISWKKHCQKSGSQSEINHAELMLSSLGPDSYNPNDSIVLPSCMSLASMASFDPKDPDFRSKGHTLVNQQLSVRKELTETNVQIAEDIIQLNYQANCVEDRIIGRYTGLFAKIDGDLELDNLKIEQELEQLKQFFNNNSFDQAAEKAILNCIASNSDEQNKIQKETIRMKEYYGSLIKNKNAEMDTLVRELAEKNHYMASAISFNSALAITKSAAEEAAIANNRLSTHSMSFNSLPLSPTNGERQFPHSPNSRPLSTVSSPRKSIKRGESFFNKNSDSILTSKPDFSGLTSDELCEVFDLSSPTVFDGEKMKKKFSTDFMYKDSYLWVIPSTRSLHWGKSAADIVNPKASKYILLDSNKLAAGKTLPPGEHKGAVKSVEASEAGIVITTHNEEFLELKVSPQTYRDWVCVLRALM